MWYGNRDVAKPVGVQITGTKLGRSTKWKLRLQYLLSLNWRCIYYEQFDSNRLIREVKV
jgi:hypothetical protein